jgi:hypothetical protein
MLYGRKIIAFTPCGRKRYMDILAAHVMREQAFGHIDEWVLFNNPYIIDDSTYADQLAAKRDWIKVVNVGKETATRDAGQISTFFGALDDPEAIYIRLDDDLCYLAEDFLPKLVRYRLDNPEPFLVYPTIINNTRTSYQLQKEGNIPIKDWGEVEPILCAPMAWGNTNFVFRLHQKALAAIENGTLVKEFELPSGTFDNYEDGNISINCFAILGVDMVACNVTRDEEGYLSKHRPMELKRFNARCGDAVVIHFAYHTQTVFMDQSGMLGDYAKLVEPLPFRTVRLTPQPVVEVSPPPNRPTAMNPQVRLAQQRALLAHQQRNRALGLTA